MNPKDRFEKVGSVFGMALDSAASGDIGRARRYATTGGELLGLLACEVRRIADLADLALVGPHGKEVARMLRVLIGD